MSKRDTLLLLEDMLESVQKIKRYTNELDYESYQEFIEYNEPSI